MKTYFYVKSSKLYCRFTDQNGEKKVVSTGLDIYKEQFIPKLQYAINNEPANELIKSWKEVANNFSIDTVANIKNYFAGSHILLSQLIDQYCSYNSELSQATIRKYKGFGKILPKDMDIPIKSINKAYILQLYTRFRTHMSLNSASKRMGQLRAFLNFGIRLEYLDKNPILNMKFKTEKKQIIFLDRDELQRLQTKGMGERLSVIRDIFVFCCYTGSEYSRVFNLKKENIHKGIDGKLWMFTKRKKTDEVANVPLLPYAVELIEKYDSDSVYCFPVRSNAKMNEYLKEIGTIAGIDKELHTHMARHTFATTVCLLEGIRPETTAKMMGITVTQLFRNYGLIIDDRVSSEFWSVYGDESVDEKDRKAN